MKMFMKAILKLKKGYICEKNLKTIIIIVAKNKTPKTTNPITQHYDRLLKTVQCLLYSLLFD